MTGAPPKPDGPSFQGEPVLRETEDRRQFRLGTDAVAQLRRFLEQFLKDEALVRQGMKPYPDGWRASVRVPAVLPHYPMVLHRGGYPDGS